MNLYAMALLVLGCASVVEVPGQVRSVVYGTGVDGELTAGVYPCSGKPDCPALIYVHGGGWMRRDNDDPILQRFADRGYVVVSVEFDNAPRAHFPAQLDELWRAAVYVKGNAKDLGVNSNEIAILGSSSGGELVALMGFGLRKPRGAPDFKAVLLNSAALDLSESSDRNIAVTAFLGGECSQLLDACLAASPLKQSVASAPPFFVGYGSDDNLVPPHQQTAFIQKLQGMGSVVKEYRADGGPHTYASDPKWSETNFREMLGFLAAHIN